MRIFWIIIFVIAHNFLFSQEICDNNIDDDLDGFIDCYDSECGGVGPCAESYQQNLNVCDSNYGLGFSLPLIEKWATGITADTRGTPVVGDIDDDCIPEIIVHNDDNGGLFVYNGITGALELQITAAFGAHGFMSPAIGDVDGDGYGEILITRASSSRLYCYEHDGSLKWTSTASIPNNTWSLNLCDFNGDGLPEIYAGNHIFNALTGALIVAGSGAVGATGTGNQAYPVAIDVLPDAFCPDCSGPELVCGDDIYSVDIGASQLTIEVSAIGVPGDNDGQTAVGDIDGDGNMEIVVASRSGTLAHVHVYDAQTGILITPGGGGTNPFVMNNDFSNANPGRNCGRPTLGDIDGDGKLEILICGDSYIGAIDDDLTELWSQYTTDVSSATLASSLFDFEGDGAFEVLYRDEDSLFIFEGATGARRSKIPCKSATRMENPVIVDADIDGQADIICTCADNTGDFDGRLKLFSSAGLPFPGTRTVWNQATYNPTVITDRLQVPEVNQGILSIPDHNNLLAQVGIYTLPVNPLSTPLPQFEFTIDNIIIGLDPCVDSTEVQITICNSGGVFFPADFSLSAYAEDPVIGGVHLTTRDYRMNPIPVSLFCVDNLNTLCLRDTFRVGPGSYTLFLVVNDDASLLPVAPSLSDDECDPSDNIQTAVISDCPLAIHWLFLNGRSAREGNVIYTPDVFEEGVHSWIQKWVQNKFVDLNNITSEKSEYLDADANVFGRVSFYRLKVKGSDGQFTFSNTLELNNTYSPREETYLFPNPISPNMTLNILLPPEESSEASSKVDILDIKGAFLYSIVVDSRTIRHIELRMDFLSKGLYFVRTGGSSGNSTVQKLLVN